jgi:hypothetical protein
VTVTPPAPTPTKTKTKTKTVTSSAAPSTPAPSTSADSCPEVDPLAVADYGASSAVDSMPVAKSYTELVTGAVTAGSQTVTLPTTATWSIGNVVSDWTGGFTYTQSVVSGDSTTASTYRIVPSANTAPTQLTGATVEPGIYLASIGGVGVPAFRAPDPGLELLSFPVIPNHTLSATATYGTRTISYTATVQGLDTINACGTPVAAWVVQLTDGTISDTAISGADGTQHFTATYDIGTQYGGIILASATQVTGTDAGTPVSRSLVTALTTQPDPPAASAGFGCVPDATVTPTVTAPDAPTGVRPTAAQDFRSTSLISYRGTAVRLPWDVSWQAAAAGGSTPTDTTYTVTRTTSDDTSTFTYRVVTPGNTGPTPPGFFLIGFSDLGATFTAPDPGVELAAFPLVAGAVLPGTPITVGTATLNLTATVIGHSTIGLCDGTALDSWQIDLTAGTFKDPDAQTDIRGITASLYLGTQYGGFPLALTLRTGVGSTALQPVVPTPSASSAAPTATPTPTSPASTTPAAPSSSPPPTPVAVAYRITEMINADPQAAP